MRRTRAIFLSAAALTVIAAAAWAQQTYYAAKPSPAVPAQAPAMSYDQALRLQQSWNGQPAQGTYAPADSGSVASAADPVGVDPEGNPVYRSAPGAAEQPAAGNSAQNEAQVAADSLRGNPQAAEQGYPQEAQVANSPYGSQPQYSQPYAQPDAQPGGYSQQSYPQKAYPQQQPYAGQGYGYAQPQPVPQTVPPPPVAVAEPYAVYPPPPPVVYGAPYPYGYPYGVGVRIGGFYRGYPFAGGYYRGYAPGSRGGFAIRGGYGFAGRGYVGAGRVGGSARGGRR